MVKKKSLITEKKNMKLIENIFMNYKIDYKKLYEEAQNEIKKLRAENKIK